MRFFISAFASSSECSFIQAKQFTIGSIKYSYTSEASLSQNGRRISLSVSIIITAHLYKFRFAILIIAWYRLLSNSF